MRMADPLSYMKYTYNEDKFFLEAQCELCFEGLLLNKRNINQPRSETTTHPNELAHTCALPSSLSSKQLYQYLSIVRD